MTRTIQDLDYYNKFDKIFFGLVYGHDKELGYFSLKELESVKCSFGLGIERDRYFGFDKKLSSVE